MSVKSIGDYSFTPKDKVENFHGNMLVYMQWEKHLSFCAPLAFPLPPDMPFGDLVAGVLAPAYAVHPDMRSQTGGCMSLGYGVLHGKASKQKLNTKVILIISPALKYQCRDKEISTV